MGKRETPSKNKPFERGLCALSSSGFNVGDVFRDFLEITTIALVNANFMIVNEKREKNENAYQNYVKKYGKNMETFSEMLADLVVLMQENYKKKTDFLGEFYMKYVTHGEHGQFFTPQIVSSMMAQIAAPKDGTRIMDCCCGSGRMLLASSVLAPNSKYIACDLDRRCCLMALINFVLYSIRGEVYWMNALTNEAYGGWYSYPPACVIQLDKEEAQAIWKNALKIEVAPHIKEQIEQKKEIVEEQIQEQKIIQNTLF